MMRGKLQDALGIEKVNVHESEATADGVSSVPTRERLQALERGLEALAFLNRFGAGTSGQVARALKLKRSTAHRILSVLVTMGLLRHDSLGHQYILCARVRELSNGFRDDAWITNVASPRLSAWTREYHWPLVLTTLLGGLMTVRASTDYESPISVDRFLAGQVIPIEGSTVGALYKAYGLRALAGMGATAGADAAEDVVAIRKAGYVARATACFTGARVSVPLVEADHFLGCITMRCRPETIADPAELEQWLVTLRTLSSGICGEAAPLLGLAG